MNPGKLVEANLPTENLKIGAHYNPQPLKTIFNFLMMIRALNGQLRDALAWVNAVEEKKGSCVQVIW